MIICSGGQTGVDENALQAACDHGLPTQGFCVASQTNETGALINPRFGLCPTTTDKPIVRTELNVKNSEATIIFYRKDPALDGTSDTLTFIKKYHKPHLIITTDQITENRYDIVATWLIDHHF